MTETAKIQFPLPAALLFLLIILLPLFSSGQKTYSLVIRCTDKNAEYVKRELDPPFSFPDRIACFNYINKLPSLLKTKGFVTASIDSILQDTASATVVLYLGQRYKWLQVHTNGADEQVLAAAGWNEQLFAGKPMDVNELKERQERMMNWMENNGYPFGKILLDSIQLVNESVSAVLIVDKGPLYKIDSIRIFGNAKISNDFLQRYLEIRNGSIYNREKLSHIPQKIKELGFVEEQQASNMSLLGTGSVLNLYLKQRRNSQVNALIGFLPANDQLSSKKMLITGEANVFLRNAFGGGEAFGLNWQQVQVKSPRLNIFYRHPYIFRSPLGIDFSFDMLRKDTSYLNINMNLGGSYILSASQSGKIFLQHFQTFISQGGVKDAVIIATRRLPDIADMSSVALGLELENYKTNYRFNPRSGYEYRLTGSAGTKKIKKNNEILELKDPADPSFDFGVLYDTVKMKSYQLRLSGTFSKYFPTGKQGTLRTAVNGGVLFSDNIFRNELFQLGGYKLLRGFDEESQYASHYVTGTAEYRYLIGLNSYFFGFIDGGWIKNNSQGSSYNHTYIGSGLGIALETKSGIFNLAWAVGKREDLQLNLRQSKIHVGFVNYF